MEIKKLSLTLASALLLTLAGCGGGGGSSSSVSSSTTSSAGYVTFTNGQNASVVIGEPDFVTNEGGASQSTTSLVGGNPDVVNSVLYLPDSWDNRVLGFNAIPSAGDNGANADFVLGASDFTTSGTLTEARTIADYNGALYVTLQGADEIAVYNTAPTANTSPDFYLTASTVGNLSSPGAIAVGGGKLVVTDTGHHRVLIWNTIPTSDTAPDLVLGQADFSGTNANAGVTATASTLNYPSGAWTDGTRLVVADQGNNRALIWNSFPTSDAQPADRVLGQTDFNSTTANQGLSAPTASTLFLYQYANYADGVYVDGNQLFVTDYWNNRVLIWNTWPSTDDQAADVVLGQADFTSNTLAATQSTLNHPSGLYLNGTRLIVGERDNSRYLVFDGHY